eukprot:m.35076 g.35076  ORF g.35076 m.35076 type:complete len:526 (-) comp8828_c0_seq1:118-1695(-)
MHTMIFVFALTAALIGQAQEQEQITLHDLQIRMLLLERQLNTNKNSYMSNCTINLGICNVRDFGAIGDGVVDDRDSIQKAINMARQLKFTVLLPPGTYRITKFLDWGNWTGISVKGSVPGPAGIGGGTGSSVILADNIMGTAHDFTASSYGVVQGIAFAGTATGAMVLNGKTLPNGYGSDITYRDCNFGNGQKGAFVNHMGEVLTWDNCRFHGSRNAPALLITWRAGYFNISAPSGRALQTAVSVTVFRLIGGELTGDNGPLVHLDMFNAPTNGGDFIASGVYYSTAGNNVSAIAVSGAWNNVVVDGSRDEEDEKPANADCGFIELKSGTLRDFRIHAYSDGDESCPIIRGTGSLVSGSINGGGSGIFITGSMMSVEIKTANSNVKLSVVGSITTSSIRAPSLAQGYLHVTGDIDIDDGGGGRVVGYQPVYSGSAQWMFPSKTCLAEKPCFEVVGSYSGLYDVGFAGDRMLLHSSEAGNDRFTTVVSYHKAKMSGTGRLELLNNKTITATFNGTGGYFTVRLLAT